MELRRRSPFSRSRTAVIVQRSDALRHFIYIDKKYLEEINEAIDFFLKTKIQDRIVFCNDTAGFRIKISLNEFLLVETYGRKLRYVMLDDSEHLCEGQISEAARSLS